jgi:hypothetical protein
VAQFNPKTQYTITPRTINIEDFHKYNEEFVVRPHTNAKAFGAAKRNRHC